MQNLKDDTNELICTTGGDSQRDRTDLWVPRERGTWGQWIGSWDQEMQTILYRIDKQQGPTNSTRNYIQYPVVNSNRKEYGKVYIYGK